MIPLDLLRSPTVLCYWCGILTAGLWLFGGPKNEVTWIHDEPALLLDGYNVIFSSGMVSSSGSGCSIELLLTPKVTFDSSTILGFYTLANPLRFSLRQHNDSLVLSSDISADKHGTESIVESSQVFQKGKQVFVVATIGAERTAIYINGQPTVTSAPVSLSGAYLLGQATSE